jgi:tRNA wybutosine-synthesizing protein 3
MDQFNQRKRDILSKKDKSSKGNWDKRIMPLCDKLNSFENYYTTSSCSGRIIVMKDEEKKGPGLFEFVSHDLVNFDSFFDKIIGFNGNLKFKQDSVILHVACRELSDAKTLLNKGLKVGFKKSGIISLGKNIIVELNLSDKLEFPLVENGELLVGKKFLKKVLKKANNNLKKGWKKIEELKLGIDS